MASKQVNIFKLNNRVTKALYEVCSKYGTKYEQEKHVRKFLYKSPLNSAWL